MSVSRRRKRLRRRLVAGLGVLCLGLVAVWGLRERRVWLEKRALEPFQNQVLDFSGGADGLAWRVERTGNTLRVEAGDGTVFTGRVFRPYLPLDPSVHRITSGMGVLTEGVALLDDEGEHVFHGRWRWVAAADRTRVEDGGAFVFAPAELRVVLEGTNARREPVRMEASAPGVIFHPARNIRTPQGVTAPRSRDSGLPVLDLPLETIPFDK